MTPHDENETTEPRTDLAEILKEHPEATVTVLEKGRGLNIKLPNGAEIEVPLRDINFNVHNTTVHPPQQTGAKVRYINCGNCGERLVRTDDPIEDHHTAMKHKQYCRTNTVMDKAQLNAAEYDRLITEFQAQPNIIEQTRKWEESERIRIEGAEAAERLRIGGHTLIYVKPDEVKPEPRNAHGGNSGRGNRMPLRTRTPAVLPKALASVSPRPDRAGRRGDMQQMRQKACPGHQRSPPGPRPAQPCQRGSDVPRMPRPPRCAPPHRDHAQAQIR